jgi:selenocysteine lyase/cysteine desulfurase
MEHDYVVDILEGAKTKGCQVTYIPLDEHGTVKYHLIEEAVTPQTKAIVCCHGSNVTGNVTDLDKVCTIARRNNLLVISDAAQTVGATPINMEELQLDVLCFTGHKKLMGPVGIGGVCLRKGLELNQSVLTNLVAPSEEKLGQLCNSLDFIFEKGIYGMSIYPHRLAKRFFESVKSMDNVTVYGDFGTHTRVPTVAITIKGFTPEEIKDFMRENHIAIASGNCQSTRLMDSLGIDERGVARFSFGYFNTRIDVNDAIWALMKLQGLDDLYLLA